jgi:hypothetical protein
MYVLAISVSCRAASSKSSRTVAWERGRGGSLAADAMGLAVSHPTNRND